MSATNNSSKVRYSVLSTVEDIAAIEQQWEELHSNCSNPTVYNSFGFIFNSIAILQASKAELFFLCVYEQGVNEKGDNKQDRLVCLFPMQSYHRSQYGIKLRVLDYAAPHEVDKPYPLIHSSLGKGGWQHLIDYLSKHYRRWDLLQLNELSIDETLIKEFSGMAETHGLSMEHISENEGPMINLNQSWQEFWDAHKKMRKKVRKVEKDFEGRVSFDVETQDFEKALNLYIDLESRSWKYEQKIGISKHPDTIQFYREFFKYLAERNRLFVGFLKVDGEVISAEVAYTQGKQAYFSHGCYDDRFANYSPGMVSTAYFLQYFFEKDFEEGDYLSGYAGYLNDWADRIQKTMRVDIRQSSINTRLFFASAYLRKNLIKPVKDYLEKSLGIRKKAIN